MKLEKSKHIDQKSPIFPESSPFYRDLGKNLRGVLLGLSFLYPAFILPMMTSQNLASSYGMLRIFIFGEIFFSVLAAQYLIRQLSWIKTEGIPVNFRLTRETSGKNSTPYYSMEYLYRYRVKSTEFHSYLFEPKGLKYQYSEYGQKISEKQAREAIEAAEPVDLRYRPDKIFEIAYDEPYFFVQIFLGFSLFYLLPATAIYIWQRFHLF